MRSHYSYHNCLFRSMCSSNVRHLRVFGCPAYAHMAKDERQKLDAKSRRCVLLGYGSERKGYSLYDPRRKRVFYCRDVVIDEPVSKEKEAVSDMCNWNSLMMRNMQLANRKQSPRMEQSQKGEDQTGRRKHLITLVS